MQELDRYCSNCLLVKQKNRLQCKSSGWMDWILLRKQVHLPSGVSEVESTFLQRRIWCKRERRGTEGRSTDPPNVPKVHILRKPSSAKFSERNPLLPPSPWDLALFQAPLFLFPGFQIKCKSASEVAPNLNIWSCSQSPHSSKRVRSKSFFFSFLMFLFTKCEMFLNVSLHRPKPSWCFHNARGCL